MKSFICLSVTPIGLAHPGVAIATTRAGGVGILDGEFCPANKADLAQKNVDQLLALTPQEQAVGLRLKATQVAESLPLLERLHSREHWLILCGWDKSAIAQALAALPPASARKLLLEITDSQQLQDLDHQAWEIDGLIARGHESGGWVGEDSAFILTQKLVAAQSRPVYVQGGIGIHTAAACRAAGAAGIVLDDQLWLMPSSPLAETAQKYLKNLNGQEAIPIGERLGKVCRVLSRPGFQAVSELQTLAEQIEIDQEAAPEREQTWQQQAQAWLGWDEPGVLAWPMGQAVGLAAPFRERYKTVGRLIQALLSASGEHLETARTLNPLQPHSPFATSHGTKYPIVQGPMTRVSDVAEFADAVSQAGALPMLALALMRKPQVENLLYKAKDLMGDRAWGVGILGFVPQALREAQLEVVKAVKPPFALIAGGRPDQAARLESEGIATYIHVPTATLLSQFLEAGARRFVFEGRECGGHVGPLSSFLLWESMIDTLLQQVPAGAESDIHVCFAGGIHDRYSAAMVAAMAAPLAQRGMRVGVLMGTAYILTREAVECGAIVEEYQQQILACKRTINLETGSGHASRCALTPFAHEFYATRRRMAKAGHSYEEIKDALEDLTLGRLRIASKGTMRDEQGNLVLVDTERQITDGMYMIGQVATLRHQACTLQDLHNDVSQGSADWLTQVKLPTSAAAPVAPSDIAIVGMSTLLPKAHAPEQYWQNILQNVDAIAEIPKDRWDWRLYYDSDREARDKIYSKWGGFIEDVAIDPTRFGIPPKSLKSIEPMQVLALEAVRRALVDAGYDDGNFDREHTSVIFGCGGGIGDLGQQYATRSEIPRFIGKAPAESWERLPEWTEESFPGILLNVVAGRVASRFDLGGSNFTVDAACASSLAAIELAVKELETGRANVAIAGGVDTVQSPFAFFCFSKTKALSPRGRSHSFDQSADGIAISEGIAIVVLKRLADAERDGDRIYAVLKGVAGSSDGKALGLTAPRPAGQRRAVNRAYAKAGFSPSTVALYEAHGTGTAAGDRAELETWSTTLAAAGALPKSCVMGSVKTAIGHTKSSAGVAALIKVALALHHKVMPPHRNVERPLEPLTDPDSPVYLLKEARPWLAAPDTPRRAGVSAFGFGGTNFHAVLEEYQGTLTPPALGSNDWPWELIVLKAENRAGLEREIQHLQQEFAAGAQPRLADLAYSFIQQAQQRSDQPACLSVVAGNLEQLQDSLAIALAHLQGKSSVPLPPHIQLGETAQQVQRPIAFLFPGQGSQYPQMAREVALYCPELRAAIEWAEQQLKDFLPKPLSQYIYPPSAYSEAEERHQIEQLKDTKVAQVALGAMELGFFQLATRLGLQADMVGGHSYGEYAALHAAGSLSQKDFLRLSALRAQVMAEACSQTDGAMAAVQMEREELLSRLKGVAGVVIANHNAPLQSVISGGKQDVQNVVERLQADGIKATLLSVSGAFHTPLVAAAAKSLAQAIFETPIKPPQIPVYANSTARPYAADEQAIKEQLSKHLLSSVEFVSQIQKMYEDGARVFIELGPKSVLTKLTGRILAGQEHVAVSLDDYGGGLRGFLGALGNLVTQGIACNLPALFSDRPVRLLNLSRLAATTKLPPLPKSAWLVNGGSARPQTEAVGYMGKLPPLNQETAAQVEVPALQSSPAAPQSKSPAAQVQPAANSQSPQPTAATNPQSARPTPGVLQPPRQPIRPTPPQRSANGYLPSRTTQNQPTMTSSANSERGLPNPYYYADHRAPLSGSEALAAYQAYQETMRQFLQLEERVMQQFLASGTLSGGSGQPGPTHSPAWRPQRPQTSQRNGPNGHGYQLPQAHLSAPPAPAPAPAAPPLAAEPPTAMPQPAPAPVAPPPATPTALTRESLTQTLIELVSDRTGYPAEMLGLDQDLEAELGIDSIKRVEVLGALQKTLPPALAEQLNREMEALTRVKTLNGMVEKILSVQSVATPAAPASNGQNGSVAPTPALLDRASLTQTLIELVSDRTGYPAEMLGLDQDLEAELGIDSIKRVEVLGALQKTLPSTLAESLNRAMEALTRVKTLKGMVEKILAIPSGEGAGLGKS